MSVNLKGDDIVNMLQNNCFNTFERFVTINHFNDNVISGDDCLLFLAKYNFNYKVGDFIGFIRFTLKVKFTITGINIALCYAMDLDNKMFVDYIIDRVINDDEYDEHINQLIRCSNHVARFRAIERIIEKQKKEKARKLDDELY